MMREHVRKKIVAASRKDEKTRRMNDIGLGGRLQSICFEQRVVDEFPCRQIPVRPPPEGPIGMPSMPSGGCMRLKTERCGAPK